MRRPHGYATLVGPGVFKEEDTIVCAHCQRIVPVKPLSDPSDMGGLCKICNGLICAPCVGKGCTPWERVMEQAEARERARKSYGL